MNKDTLRRPGEKRTLLLQKAAEVVRGYGLGWNVVEIEAAGRGFRPDAHVEITHGRQKIRFAVEAKPHLRAGQAGAITAQHQQVPGRWLLLTDYVNPRLAEELHRRNVNFVDMAGNAFLQAPSLLVWVTGRKAIARIQLGPETRRAFKPAGLRVVFALLYDPDLVKKDYRALAAQTGTAVGTVHDVFDQLRREGYLIRKGRAARRLVDLDRLLDEWALAYARELEPRTLLGRYDTTAFEKWRTIRLEPHQAAWGGEAAAALLTDYLKPGTLTLWTDTVPPRLIAELGLRPTDQGRVELRRRFWNRDLVTKRPDGQTDHERTTCQETAPPVLVYAELMAIGDARTTEAAKQVREAWIRGPLGR